MQVQVYNAADQPSWDAFVRNSKNGTFLFLRNYMDYHADRFADYSLIVRDGNGSILSVLPANRDGNSLISHGGLTYGGFVSDEKMTVSAMLKIFAAVLGLLRQRGFDRLLYKAVPYIYHKVPAEEDRYALFLAGARRVRCDVLTVIRERCQSGVQQRRLRGMKNALKHGLTVRQSLDFAQYWDILSENLLARHRRLPVHTLPEIVLLNSRFPEQLKLFGCFDGDSILAGVVIYESDRVAHAQYISANERGKEIGALDLLFHVLLSEIYPDKPFFDFGISTESDGRYFNRGLSDQKEGFGGRAVVHEHYEIDLTSWDAAGLLAEG